MPLRIRALAALTLGTLSLALVSGCSGDPAPVDTPERRSFDVAIPFEMDVLTEFEGIDPTIEDERYVQWDLPTRSDLAVRVLEPTVVRPPGSDAAEPVPADYAGYLTSLPNAEVSDPTTLDVDGVEAQVFTIRVSAEAGFGSLGCVDDAADPQDDTACHELVDGRTYRLAVISHDDGLVLLWARTSSDREEPEFFDRFDAALESLTFTG